MVRTARLTPGHEKKYPVTFQISGFEQSFENLKTSDSLSKYIDVINYIVFNPTTRESIKLIDQRAQNDPAPRFGVITDSLPAGQYIIGIIGSLGDVNIGHDAIDDSFFKLLWMPLPGTDIFYKRIELTVSGSVNQIVSLDRIVGKLKVVIQDRIPFDAKRIEIRPNIVDPHNPQQTVGSPNGLNLIDGTMIPVDSLGGLFRYSPLQHDFTTEEKGMENFTIECYHLLKGATTIKVDITATDAQSRVLGAKTVQGVQLFAGKGTVLSGKLFDGLGTSDSGVNVILNDPEWVNDSVKINF